MDFRKSSHSMTNGNCLEAGSFRKSSRSISNGACVEVGQGGPAIVVRDTRDRDGVSLAISASAWAEFLGRYCLTIPGA